MSQPIQFWSHKIGPNPWKNVIVFEELGVPYATEYLDFGNNTGGVEHPSFLKKNAAGRVPLIHDPATATEQDKYLADKYLGFQSSTQAPFYAQSLQMRNKKNFDGVAHFQHLAKRTLRTIDDELRGKQFLVSGKCTLADLAFIPWDLMLDLVLQGDTEAGTASDRKELFLNWYNWHVKMIQREAVQKMMKLKEEANAN